MDDLFEQFHGTEERTRIHIRSGAGKGLARGVSLLARLRGSPAFRVVAPNFGGPLMLLVQADEETYLFRTMGPAPLLCAHIAVHDRNRYSRHDLFRFRGPPSPGRPLVVVVLLSALCDISYAEFMQHGAEFSASDFQYLSEGD